MIPLKKEGQGDVFEIRETAQGPSSSRSIRRARTTSLGGGGGMWSFVARIGTAGIGSGAAMDQLFNARRV